MKRRAEEDMGKIKESNHLITELFMKVPIKEFWDFTEKFKEIEIGKEDFKKHLKKRMMNEKVNLDDLREEYIDYRVNSFYKIKRLQFQQTMHNQIVRQLKGSLSHYQTALHFLLLGKYPDLLPELHRLREKNNKLRKENHEIKSKQGENK